MTHGIKHFLWRDGRPRWVPSPRLRGRGARGRDLKDADGQWLDIGAAINLAIKINDEWSVNGPKPQAADPPGFVYFMRAGDAVKIGYSTDVMQRRTELQTGSAEVIDMIVAVRRRKSFERMLHRRFARHRLHGEWFKAVPAIIALMASIQHGEAEEGTPAGLTET